MQLGKSIQLHHYPLSFTDQGDFDMGYELTSYFKLPKYLDVRRCNYIHQALLGDLRDLKEFYIEGIKEGNYTINPRSGSDYI